MSDVREATSASILLQQKLAPIEHHNQQASKTILPTSIINGEDCLISISGGRSTIDTELLTTGNTKARTWVRLRTDPPKPLPVGNVCLVGGVVTKEYNLG